MEQKQVIIEKDVIIQELTASQHPPIMPDKRKIKVVEKEVIKEVTVKDEKCVEEYDILRQKALQCAYNLKFCQESSEIYGRLNDKGTDETKE